jgi:hypothetical protein
VVFFSGAGNTGTVLSRVLIYGVGTGPQAAFSPAPEIAIAPTVDGIPLKYPGAVLMDPAGNLLIADTYNSRVLEMPAGGGTPFVVLSIGYPWGLALDGAGDLFVSEYYGDQVIEMPAGGGADTVVSRRSTVRDCMDPSL